MPRSNQSELIEKNIKKMVGTRRNKSTGGNDPDPESNKPKKLTKAQLKQMDDVCVCFFNEIL